MLAGTLLWLALPWALPWLLARSRGGWLAPLRAAAARPDWRRQLVWQALASAAVQVLSALALACGGLALGVALPAAVWAWAIAPVFLMAALPVSVGGWGAAPGRRRGRAGALCRGGARRRGRGRDLWRVWPGAGRAGCAGLWTAARCGRRRQARRLVLI